MVLGGLAIVLGWRALGWHETVVYEVMPGMIGGLLIYGLGRGIEKAFLHRSNR